MDGAAYRSGIYKIPTVRMSESSDESSNERVYSPRVQKCIRWKHRACGLLRIVTMKPHMPSWAVSSAQANRGNLRVYVKIGKTERRKL